MNNDLKKIIFFILLLALCYVAYMYMIKPAKLELVTQKQKVIEKMAKLEELKRATATADDLNKQLIRVEEAIRLFESRLPPKSQIHTVLENVTVIAQRHGLRPKTIRALKMKDNNGYIEQPLKMELHGNFTAYYSFLLELERLERITKIRKLSLRKKSELEGQTEATFEMSIFFQNKSI